MRQAVISVLRTADTACFFLPVLNIRLKKSSIMFIISTID